MRLLKAAMALVILLLAMDGADAQSTHGTIRGHVADTQGLPLPGVTVVVRSPALQGERLTVTEENGDYLISLLPPGTYVVAFELSGLERREETVTLAATQSAAVSVALGPADIRESVEVTAAGGDVLLGTTQVASSFKQAMVNNLPTNRDITATLLLAPGVHATGPAGSYSVSGAMSFENLFMVNGVTVNENIRGQAQNLYIEDAIQETTVAAAGVSAEYGRFGGGVVNVITKSGGNRFGGSFRENLHNDSWRAQVKPRSGDLFTSDPTLDDVVPTHEYTLGGPIVRDRLWFFTAGRLQKQAFSRELVRTGIPYVNVVDNRRFEGKATYSPVSSHRFQGAFTGVRTVQENNTLNTSQSMDLNSLENRRVPEELATVNYSGTWSSRLFVEARYSARSMTITGSGSPFRDRINGTLLVDTAGRRYWSATFCSHPDCPPEERDNQDLFAKGTYFFSGRGPGSHSVSVGADAFNDRRVAQNYQSGSDYRILNADATLIGTELYPKFTAATGTMIRWQPIVVPTQGTSFRTISAFVNDAWSVTPRLSANLGLRLDKNRGRNSSGELAITNSAWSPRLGLVWDVAGDQRWIVSGSAGKYVAGILNTIADMSSAGGNADQYTWAYAGPAINTDPAVPLIPTAQALAQLFQWFDANGGTSRALAGTPAVRGVSSRPGEHLKSPSNWEYAAGVSRQFGPRLAWRNDFIFRNYNDFYVLRTDRTTGTVRDTRPGSPALTPNAAYDLVLVENTNLLDRRYGGWTSQLDYRPAATTDIGATYTLSRAWGNVDGETANGGPVASDILQYPEYKQAAWYAPDGDLSIDQRHRARLWVNYGVPGVRGLITSVVQTIESGVPYGALAANGVNSAAYVPPGLGYLTPPSGAQIQYYYTARDAFRTEGQRRTDWAATYSRRVGGSRTEIYGQVQVINVFNQSQLCGCGASVFSNGGNVQSQFIDATARTALTANSGLQGFNPFTTTPVEGVHWAKGPNFGHAVSRFAYTTPRMLRLTFGVRF